MLEFLGRFAFRRPWVVVAAWLVLIACVLPVLGRIEEPLKVGGFSSNTSEGARAIDLLERELGFSPSQLAVIYTSDSLPANNPAFKQRIDASLAHIHDLPYVQDVVTPALDPTLIAPSNTLAYAIVGLSLPPEQAQREAGEIEALIVDQPDLDIVVAGGPSFYADIETASQRDLRRAEIIAFPIA
ncbi:MAG TPA: MMPL family transporter, partial [Thermomicrobiales bacterium]|nr:MMPL family transporter [Thermomicrobiales bacterium]